MRQYHISKKEFKGCLSRLLETPEPPDELWVEGSLPPENHKILVVVGSRKYTSYGEEVCETLVSGLVGSPITIVSGLALGIDTLAHKAALVAGMHTIAIPGSGLDRNVLYPSTNRRLAENILCSGGALISELDLKERAARWTFPKRNRLMAGIADAVLVIEATDKSGTLITSRLATEYNRDVLTVPGSIFARGSAGPHMLIRLGATPITSSVDILEALNLPTPTFGDPISKRNLSSEEEQIVVLISEQPLSRDELSRNLNIPIHRLNITLTTLELKGVVIERIGLLHLNQNT